MVADTEGSDALPLVAHTLAELYQRAAGPTNGAMSDRDYEQLGGVVGALRAAPTVSTSASLTKGSPTWWCPRW